MEAKLRIIQLPFYAIITDLCVACAFWGSDMCHLTLLTNDLESQPHNGISAYDQVSQLTFGYYSSYHINNSCYI